jgi:Holliday junction resolvase RusA-like endonuclease
VTRSIVLDLPKPLSVNNLFFNLPNRGRAPTPEYKTWKKEAAKLILSQKPSCMIGAVELKYTFEHRPRADLGNFEKACTDALVENGIIDGDRHATVKRITLEWGDVIGARVEISPAVEWKPRRAA